MTRIVITTYRRKRPQKRLKVDALAVPAVITRTSKRHETEPAPPPGQR